MFFPLAIIIIGVILLLENLGVITGNIWEWVWPSLIVILGLSMLFKPFRKKRMSEGDHITASPDAKFNSEIPSKETASQHEEIEEGEFEEK